MIVCQCNNISTHDIARASAEFVRQNPGVPVTVEAVYQVLGKQPRCGSCLGLAACFVASPPEAPRLLAEGGEVLTSPSDVG